MSEPLVIIGNGMAAARLVEELTGHGIGRYAIAVIGDERRLAYNRVLLSSVLAGEMSTDEIELRCASWWHDRGVTLVYGRGAHSIDTGTNRVILEDGTQLPYGKLVFATGSQPLRLPIPGIERDGVHSFRDSRDVEILANLGRLKQRVAVIGGGLLGLEAAYGLVRAGARVTLIHLMDRLMERQLDSTAGDLLKREVEARGIDVLLNASTAEIFGDQTVRGIGLADGRIIDADAAVIAAGIRPNADLAKAAGLEVRRGIVVDDTLAASVTGFYAIGECAEHRGICYGLVEPAYEQARVLASHLAGKPARYEGSVVATNLKVSGVNVFSAGDFIGEGAEEIILRDPGSATYKKLVLRGGSLVGAVLVGDTADALWYLSMIRNDTPVAPLRHTMMFGRALTERKAA